MGSYPSAEKQSVYSTAPTHIKLRGKKNSKLKERTIFIKFYTTMIFKQNTFAVFCFCFSSNIGLSLIIVSIKWEILLYFNWEAN